jgi:hypothetical protein
MYSTKILYLDQNAVIWLADRRLPKTCAKVSIESLIASLIEAVARKSCVVPFSPLHLQETRNAEAESREKVCEFFDQFFGGYQFLDGAVILGQQARSIFLDRQPSFNRKDAVAKTGYSFRSLLPGPPPKVIYVNAYRDVTERWASMTQMEIAASVKKEEAETFARLVERLNRRVLSGQADDPWEFLGLPNALFCDLCEAALQTGQHDPQVAALDFLRRRILEVPSINIHSEMLAKEAAYYAKDIPRPRSPNKSFLNSANDIEIASTYVPYCDVVLTERGRAESIRQCKNLFPRRPHVFTAQTLDDFHKWVSDLPAPAYKTPSLEDWLLHLSALPKQRIAVGMHPTRPDFLIDESDEGWFEERLMVREVGGGGAFVASGLDGAQPDKVAGALDDIMDFWDRMIRRQTGDFQLEITLYRPGVGCATGQASMPFGIKALLEPSLPEVVKRILSQ